MKIVISAEEKSDRSARFVSPEGAVKFSTNPVLFSFNAGGLSKLLEIVRKNKYSTDRIDLENFSSPVEIRSGHSKIGSIKSMVVSGSKRFYVSIKKGEKW